MSNRAFPFFLPVCRETVATLIRDGSLPTAAAELAAIMAITMFRRSPGLSKIDVERVICDVQQLVPVGRDVAAEKVLEAWQALPSIGIKELEDQLMEASLVFAPGARWPSTSDPIERYTSEFQDQHKIPMQSVEIEVWPSEEDSGEFEDEFEDDYETRSRVARPVVSLTGTRDQALVARTVLSMHGEHIEADAFAGAGKTHLIMRLLSSAPSQFTYVTPYRAHMDGGMAAAGGVLSFFNKQTLWGILHEAAQPYLTAKGITRLRLDGGNLSPADRAARAGIGPIGKYSPAEVVLIAHRALNSWAESSSSVIGPEHFQRALPYNMSRAPFTAAANALWEATWAPIKGGRFPISTSLLAKWLLLQGATTKASLGTLLVDEAHDLKPSWRQLLDRHPSGCVFFGDPYQRLRGRIPRHDRNKVVTMNHSFRMGINGEDAIRKTLESSPVQRVFDVFVGSRSHITRVRHGTEMQEGLRIFANEWALLEDAQWLKKKQGSFRILRASSELLEKLVKEAHELFTADDPNSNWKRMAGGYLTWDELATDLAKAGRKNVIRMFESGYNPVKFDEMLAAQAPEGAQKITLGMIAHVKNMQASAVTLSDCCYTDAQERHGYQPAHAVYLAMSRVRDQLWLPPNAFDRLTELKAGESEPWEVET